MNRIAELRKVRDDINRLTKLERRLSQPLLQNLGMVRNLYEVYKNAITRQMGDPYDTDNRKKFLYAIIYCFSPTTLVGDAMRHRLRETVSSVIGCTNTGVSRDYKTAQFFYDTYREFRESTNLIIKEILTVTGIHENIS